MRKVGLSRFRPRGGVIIHTDGYYLFLKKNIMVE